MRVYLLQGSFFAVDTGTGKVRMHHLSTKNFVGYTTPKFMLSNEQYIVGSLEGEYAAVFLKWVGAEV
jgi:hypothetical protein